VEMVHGGMSDVVVDRVVLLTTVLDGPSAAFRRSDFPAPSACRSPLPLHQPAHKPRSTARQTVLYQGIAGNF